MNIIPEVNKDQLSKEQIEYLQKKQHELKLLGHQKRVPGHILWSYNIKTGEIKQADIERRVIVLPSAQAKFENKVVIEADCIYVQALNKKNLLKKLMK